MELVKSGDETIVEVFAWLSNQGIKPRFWAHAMELWGVAGRDYGEYVAPRATSAQAWMQMKYDQKVPMRVKLALAQLEVVMVERFQHIERAAAMIAQGILDKKDRAAMLMAFLCFPPCGLNNGLLDTPAALARSAGMRIKTGYDTTNARLLDMIG